MTAREASSTTEHAITGVAAGVPFVAVPPGGGAQRSAPTVVAWHLLDSPRTEAALAATVPLDGLDAWRIYLGLPMTGARIPAGGPDELMRLGAEDAVLGLHGPIVKGAAAEFEPALAELRERLGLDEGALGLMGGSDGAAVAALVLAEGDVDVDAAVLVSPVVRLRSLVEMMERLFGFSYPWSEASHALAGRIDFIARAGEIAERRHDPAVVLIVGEDDDVEGIREPAIELQDALRGRYAEPGRAELVLVPGMGHVLAEEPGVTPAPQTAAAAEVDRRAVRWFRRHLA